jgi:hypothetical protein
MLVVAFGPGYGPQYAYWFLPSLIAAYVLLDDRWRTLLLVAYAIAAVTYAVEYAFVPFLGEYARAVFGDRDWVTEVSEHLSDPQWLVLFRLPLFAVYLVVLAEGLRRLSNELRADASAEADARRPT